MKLSLNLEKHLQDLVGKNVYSGETIIGKVIEYDIKTGFTTVEVNNLGITSGLNIGISSRKDL